MDKKQLKQITQETFNFLNNKGVGFICYMWDRKDDFSGGCQSADADMGDAMVAITRITKHFNIDPHRLHVALTEARLEMEEN